jgi:hypothetical protein
MDPSFFRKVPCKADGMPDRQASAAGVRAVVQRWPADEQQARQITPNGGKLNPNRIKFRLFCHSWWPFMARTMENSGEVDFIRIIYTVF